MTVAELQDQIKQLDDTEFQELLAWVVTPERERRQAEEAVEAARAKDAQELWQTHPELKPQFATEVEPETSIDQLLRRSPHGLSPPVGPRPTRQQHSSPTTGNCGAIAVWGRMRKPRAKFSPAGRT